MQKTFGKKKKVSELEKGQMYYCPIAGKVVMMVKSTIYKKEDKLEAMYYNDTVGRYCHFLPEDNQLLDFEFTRLQ